MDTTAIWQPSTVIDELDEIIRDNSKWDLVLAQIPSMFGYSKKATYLGFRAVGLTTMQALNVLGESWETLVRWHRDCPEMKEFEADKLYELQSKVSADIIRLGFLRNMTMLTFKDQQVIQESLSDLDNMSKRNFEYLKAIRRFYSTHDLLALEKAVAPEKHREQTIVLSFGDNHFELTGAGEGENQLKLVEGEYEAVQPTGRESSPVDSSGND